MEWVKRHVTLTVFISCLIASLWNNMLLLSIDFAYGFGFAFGATLASTCVSLGILWLIDKCASLLRKKPQTA